MPNCGSFFRGRSSARPENRSSPDTRSQSCCQSWRRRRMRRWKRRTCPAELSRRTCAWSWSAPPVPCSRPASAKPDARISSGKLSRPANRSSSNYRRGLFFPQFFLSFSLLLVPTHSRPHHDVHY